MISQHYSTDNRWCANTIKTLVWHYSGTKCHLKMKFCTDNYFYDDTLCLKKNWKLDKARSSPPEIFLLKGVLKIRCKFTGEHPYRSAISIKLESYFIEISLRNMCSPVNLLLIFRALFSEEPLRRLASDRTPLVAGLCKGYWPEN